MTNKETSQAIQRICRECIAIIYDDGKQLRTFSVSYRKSDNGRGGCHILSLYDLEQNTTFTLRHEFNTDLYHVFSIDVENSCIVIQDGMEDRIHKLTPLYSPTHEDLDFRKLIEPRHIPVYVTYEDLYIAMEELTSVYNAFAYIKDGKISRDDVLDFVKSGNLSDVEYVPIKSEKGSITLPSLSESINDADVDDMYYICNTNILVIHASTPLGCEEATVFVYMHKDAKEYFS